MEFIEFLNLIRKYFTIFLILFLILFFGGLFFYKQQSQIYLGSVAVNISREGQVETGDYQYDQFYRLEADEKFGKNIVNWLGDPGMINLNKVEFEKLRRGSWIDIYKIKAIQSSANYIKIEFKSKTSRSAFAFGNILKKTLNKKTQQLNVGQDKNNWFKLIIDDPQVSKNQVNIYLVLVVTICLGVLAGIFGVLIRHYFSKNENRN